MQPKKIKPEIQRNLLDCCGP